MQPDITFLLDKKIEEWSRGLKTSPELTEQDSEELKIHLLDSISELKDNGLDDEEAFWVATKRLGSTCDFEKDFGQVNNQIIQMRKSLVIFAGVLVYNLLYYIILSTSKLLFIFLLLTGKDGYIAVDWISNYVVFFHFLFVLFAASIYFFENITISFIEKVNIKPRGTILLFAITFAFGILNTILTPKYNSIISQNRNLQNPLYDIFLYFNYSFPLIICVAFIVLYFKYYNKAKY